MEIEDSHKKEQEQQNLRKSRFSMKKPHWIGIFSAFAVVFISVLLFFLTEFVDLKLLYFLIGISLVMAGLPFFATLLFSAREEQNKEQMFLEFSRDLVEGVKSGTSISKSIMNVQNKDYGKLNPHIDKLANQIGLGIPVKEAFENFSADIKNRIVSRAITLIQEAERAGGRIETILESVAYSVGQIEKLRKERQAAIYNLAVQGYIVFLIFIAIMLVMQFKILPITSDIGAGGLSSGGAGFDLGTSVGGLNLGKGGGLNPDEMARSFLYLLIVQGFFAGLVIGKISEGSAKAGLRHSFILVTLAILISTGATVIFGA